MDEIGEYRRYGDIEDIIFLHGEELKKISCFKNSFNLSVLVLNIKKQWKTRKTKI